MLMKWHCQRQYILLLSRPQHETSKEAYLIMFHHEEISQRNSVVKKLFKNFYKRPDKCQLTV